MAASPRRLGAAMLHPAVALAIVVLVVNDHVAKGAFPGWATGKVSDFAGLLFFPVLVFVIIELVAAAVRADLPGRSTAIAVCVVSGLAFGLVKTVPSANQWYEDALAVLRWAPGAVFAAVSGSPASELSGVDIVRDPTDLVALVAVIPAWLILQRAVARPRDTPASAPASLQRPG